MIEFLAAMIFLAAIIVGHVVSEIESRKRAAEAAKEAAISRINWALEDARRLGSTF